MYRVLLSCMLVTIMLPWPTAGAKLFINEILPDPEGGTDEWVELYNSWQTASSLSGFSVIVGEDTEYSFASGDTIASGSFTVVLLDSHYALNNDGNTVLLLDASGNTVDSMSYSWSFKSTSISRSFSGVRTWRHTKLGSGGNASKGFVNGSDNRPPNSCIQLQGDAKFNKSWVVVLGPEYGDINVTGECAYDLNGDRLWHYWDYGDGSTQSGFDAGNVLAHSYWDPGVYELRHTVQDAFGMSHQTGITVHVSENIAPQIHVARQGQATGARVHLSDRINFTGSGTHDPDQSRNLYYAWDFGTGNVWSGTGVDYRNPGPYRYKQTGSYIVSYTVRDRFGAQSVWTGSIQVYNNTPEAQIDVQGDATWSGDTVIIGVQEGELNLWGSQTKNPDNEVLHFSWDYGNGITKSGTGWDVQEPGAVYYSGAGIYNIELTVTDPYGQADTTEMLAQVLPNTPPIPKWELQGRNPSWNIYKGQSINLTGEGTYDKEQTQNLYYSWDFGNGSEYSGTGVEFRNPNAHSYDETGQYTLRYTVRDEFGAKTTKSHTVKVTKRPNTSGGGWWGGLVWSFKNDASSTQKAQQKPQNKPPVAKWELQGRSPSWTIAPGQSINMTGQGTKDQDQRNNLHFAWDFGDGSEYSGTGVEFRNPLPHVYSQTGTYTLRYTVTDKHGAKDSKQHTVTVTKESQSNTESQNKDTQTPACQDLQITEILPNAKGVDRDKEWIELWNTGSKHCYIDAFLWTEPGEEYEVHYTGSIAPGEFFIYWPNPHGVNFSLDNKDGRYCLHNRSGQELDCVSYGHSDAGISYFLNPKTKRFKKTRPNPGRRSFLTEQKELSCTVQRVIDGDTFVCKHPDMGMFPVRMIGVDTPETLDPRKTVQYFGIEASKFSKQKLGGKQVKLTFESDPLGVYHRVLAYVYLDNTLFNKHLIQEGYAFAYTNYPFSKMEAFVAAQAQARRQNKGLYAPKSDEEMQKAVDEYKKHEQKEKKQQSQSGETAANEQAIEELSKENQKQEQKDREEKHGQSMVDVVKTRIVQKWNEAVQSGQMEDNSLTRKKDESKRSYTPVQNSAYLFTQNAPKKMDITLQGIITKSIDAKHAYMQSGEKSFRLDGIRNSFPQLRAGDKVWVQGKFWDTQKGPTIKIYSSDVVRILMRGKQNAPAPKTLATQSGSLRIADVFKEVSLSGAVTQKDAHYYSLGNVPVRKPDAVHLEPGDALQVQNGRVQLNSNGEPYVMPANYTVQYNGPEVDMLRELLE